MKLRVIAGSLGGRWFEAPGGNTTHPMGERIRGALFNSLGNISAKTVLDPFSGSGALSFEAVSRGAAMAVALERDKKAQRSIEQSIADLKVRHQVRLIKANCRTWSQNNPHQKFDLILCDPPYHAMQLSTVEILITHLKPNGLMVLSYPGRESAPTVNGVVVVDNSWYGDAALAYYRIAQSD